jgi:hydroxymethylpyrimidine/phosphomethylpyrimidine kinase
MVASAPVTPRCLSIAGSDSGGGAGVQADLKAFARCGCHGMTAIVALTAQSTAGVSGIHPVPPAFVEAQLEALYADIGVDAVKTGMLFATPIVETVASFLATHPGPLVVDPVMVASSGATLLEHDAAEALVARLFPLATVVTPNLHEACVLAGTRYSDDVERRDLAEAIHAVGAAAVVVTGGHGVAAVDWLFDGRRHVSIPVERLPSAATHGAGCTHSAALAAMLAQGLDLEDAARGAARIASEAVRNGLSELGEGPGPVDVLGLEELGREAVRAR